mmetsp:Transcript_10319/g.19419  ORF Transcript_10319/g.19419 Transcript_10319/m.19419 type:complete len:266 (-) Transcript_10319:340-1137(-)
MCSSSSRCGHGRGERNTSHPHAHSGGRRLGVRRKALSHCGGEVWPRVDLRQHPRGAGANQHRILQGVGHVAWLAMHLLGHRGNVRHLVDRASNGGAHNLVAPVHGAHLSELGVGHPQLLHFPPLVVEPVLDLNLRELRGPALAPDALVLADHPPLREISRNLLPLLKIRGRIHAKLLLQVLQLLGREAIHLPGQLPACLVDKLLLLDTSDCHLLPLPRLLLSPHCFQRGGRIRTSNSCSRLLLLLTSSDGGGDLRRVSCSRRRLR